MDLFWPSENEFSFVIALWIMYFEIIFVHNIHDKLHVKIKYKMGLISGNQQRVTKNDLD